MATITYQPITFKPVSFGHVPQGLAPLAQIDQLIIKQKGQLLEGLTQCGARSKHEIFNSLNQQIYYAKEESSCCMRCWCGPYRGFIIHITDNIGQEDIVFHRMLQFVSYVQEVMTMTRELRCCGGCCWCADGSCGFLLKVEAPPGNVVGYCKQRTSCCILHLELMDAGMQPLFKIWGPCCPFCQCICCPHDVSFRVKDINNPDKIHANITKMWTGSLEEIIKERDTFQVTFPLEMDVKQKATIIGAAFLVEFIAFEIVKHTR